MNSIDTKLIEKYKEELQDLQLGYSFNRKNINYMLELVYLSMFVDSEYATDEEIFKYSSKWYDIITLEEVKLWMMKNRV